MLDERLRTIRARLPRTRRTDLKVAAYCHAFEVKPGTRADGGREPDERDG